MNIDLLWFCTIEETEDTAFIILSHTTLLNHDFVVYGIPPERLLLRSDSVPLKDNRTIGDLDLMLNLQPAETHSSWYLLDTK